MQSTERKLLPQIVLRATKLGDALRSFQQVALTDCSKSELVFSNFENEYFLDLAKKTVGNKRPSTQEPLIMMHNPQPKRKALGTIIGYTRKSFQDLIAASPPRVSNFHNTLATADPSKQPQTIVIDFSKEKK